MIERYKNPEIDRIWDDANKVALWQKVECAIITARSKLLRYLNSTAKEIKNTLSARPCDLEWWKGREKILHHDLNAWVDERRRLLPPNLRRYFHQDMTSYDTEESAFVTMLNQSCLVIIDYLLALKNQISKKAGALRFTPFNERTHGQEAEMMSIGKRFLNWHQDLEAAWRTVNFAKENLLFSKLSGAIGNHQGIDPELEEKALELLGFKPWLGSTQILPRTLFVPLACGLAQVVTVCDKISQDIRLGARSGRPIYQEPFSKSQKGSSAMPHKRNPIGTEKIAGMARMARARLQSIVENSVTWEGRAIEQSSVERVEWPDLFHITAHALETLTKVLAGLVLYPDNMLLEIRESRGCYASNAAKELLAEFIEDYKLEAEDAYRIVQRAAFMVHEAQSEATEIIRQYGIKSLGETDKYVKDRSIGSVVGYANDSIEEIIEKGILEPFDSLETTEDDKVQVAKWNEVLRKVFAHRVNIEKWHVIFQPSYCMRHEAYSFKKVFGV